VIILKTVAKNAAKHNSKNTIMKKLLLSSIILLLFSCSMLLFQISCQKQANARTNETGSNKIVYSKYDGTSVGEIWTANIDGTNQQKVNVTLPSNTIAISTSVSKDGSKIIFATESNDSTKEGIYTCNIDGTNLTKVINAPSSGWVGYVSAY